MTEQASEPLPESKLTIPTQYIQLSLNPNSTSVLTRHGIPWFVHVLISVAEVNSPDEVGATLDAYIREGDQVLKHSAMLKQFDLEDETQVEQVCTLLEQKQGSLEWWALRLAGLATLAKRAVEANDARRTAWIMSKLASSRAMLLFHRTLEQYVWVGYSAAHLRKMLNLLKANEENANEEFWQQTMASNAMILSQLFSFPAVILKGKAYLGGKGIDNIGGKLIDFLVTNQLGNNAALVEIKTPTMALLAGEYRDGVFPPSTELSGAITQILRYKDTFSKEYHTLKGGSSQGFNAFDPPCMVIAGNFRREITTPDKHAFFDLFRHSIKGVQIVTYDEVFAKIEVLVKLLGV